MISLPGLRSRGGFLIGIFLRYFLHKLSPLHRFTPAERPRVSGWLSWAGDGVPSVALCGALWRCFGCGWYFYTFAPFRGSVGLSVGSARVSRFRVSCCGALWLALVPSVGSDPLAGTGVPVERSGAVRARKKPPTRSGRTGERKPRDRSRGCFYLFIFSKSATRTKKKIITHNTINNLAALPSMLP